MSEVLSFVPGARVIDRNVYYDERCITGTVIRRHRWRQGEVLVRWDDDEESYILATDLASAEKN